MFKIINKTSKITTKPIKTVVHHYKKQMTEFVWSDSSLENNPITFVEIKTILDGVTLGGHKISDLQQVLNLKRANEFLIQLVLKVNFKVDKETFCLFNKIVSFEESLECGCFRGEGEEKNYSPYVHLSDSVLNPISTPDNELLNLVFENGLQEINKISNPIEKAFTFFLFGALNQFFFDGNKRTSRYMMNGILMSNGLDAVSIPVSKKHEFNQKMINFYKTQDGNEMFDFLTSCQSKPTNQLKMK